MHFLPRIPLIYCHWLAITHRSHDYEADSEEALNTNNAELEAIYIFHIIIITVMIALTFRGIWGEKCGTCFNYVHREFG